MDAERADRMGQLLLVDVGRDCAHTTLRARRVLCEATLIVARDSATIAPFLDEAEIDAPLLDLAACDVTDALRAVLHALGRGDVAWVSPGLARWEKGDEAILDGLLARGIEVLAVPGGSALIAGLVRSGLPADRFFYLGTLPPSSQECRGLLRGVLREPYTMACAVEVADLAPALRDVEATLGGSRRMAACWGDEVWRGVASTPPGAGLAPDLCYLFVEGATEEQAWTEEQVRCEVSALLVQGASTRDAAQTIAQRSGWRRRAVYRIAVQMSDE
jgi:16S rRNA (cytidine1402-2'-O)-methyltransferase